MCADSAGVSRGKKIEDEEIGGVENKKGLLIYLWKNGRNGIQVHPLSGAVLFYKVQGIPHRLPSLVNEDVDLTWWQ